MSTNHLPSLITTKAITFNGITTPEALFALMADLPWAMWLDSCESNHVDSRYDIIVWQPRVTLSTSGKNTEISWYEQSSNEPAEKQLSQEEPLNLIKTIQAKVFESCIIKPSKHAELPFQCGTVGYWGYDLAHHFEQLPSTTNLDIKAPDMAVGIYQHAIVYDRQSESFSLVCLTNKREKLSHWLNELIEDKTTKQVKFSLTTDWQSNTSKSEYKDKFEKIQNYLLSGDCYQINLAQRFSAQYKGDEFIAYQALRNANQAPFSAFIRLDNTAILSISPERFLQLKHGKVQSKPIKGTRPRSLNKAIDRANAAELQQATKDRAENVMIVDLLRNDISKVCIPGTVDVPKLFDIESFPAVHHLVSTVEGELAPQYDGTDLLRASFPGGSITGAPKIRAMQIIDELEPDQRSVYCGSIGYISACGNMDSSITIRTLICQSNSYHETQSNTYHQTMNGNTIEKPNKMIYCWAGGGLVADSKVDCEYQETFDKVQRILPVLKAL